MAMLDWFEMALSGLVYCGLGGVKSSVLVWSRLTVLRMALDVLDWSRLTVENGFRCSGLAHGTFMLLRMFLWFLLSDYRCQGSHQAQPSSVLTPNLLVFFGSPNLGEHKQMGFFFYI